jgi:MFS family permease
MEGQRQIPGEVKRGTRINVLNRWLGRKPMSRDFWIFFLAALLFDFGFGLYFFLFNLYLTTLHLDEKVVGRLTGLMMVGGVAATIPVGLLVKRVGIKPLMLFCTVAAPLAGILRVVFVGAHLQLALALLFGATLCVWPVCFSPTLARLTNEDNRAFGFSICFATGIGSGALAGLVGGYLPDRIRHLAGTFSLESNMRALLILACVAVALATVPMSQLSLRREQTIPRRRSSIDHFLMRFLIVIAVWNFAIGSFLPFANIYLMTQLKVPLAKVGVVFSVSQITQVGAVLVAPILFRWIGPVGGIAFTQLITGVALISLGHAHNPSAAIVIYLGLTGFQWMSNPGVYSLLMNNMPDESQGTASALQNVVTALSQAAAAVCAGNLVTAHGYPRMFAVTAVIAIASAALVLGLLGPRLGIVLNPRHLQNT